MILLLLLVVGIGILTLTLLSARESSSTKEAISHTKWNRLTSFFLISIAFSAVLFLGVEASTPSYHLSDDVAQRVFEAMPTLEGILNFDIGTWLDNWNSEGTEEVEYNSNIASLLKQAVFFGMLFFFFASQAFTEPLSDNSLLELHASDVGKKLPFYLRLFKEIKFYAIIHPASKMNLHCKGCNHRDKCPNNLVKEEIRADAPSAFYLWQEIYHALPASQIDSLNRNFLLARFALSVRYITLNSAIILSCIYLIVRIYELIFLGQLNLNPELLIYIGFLLAIAYIFLVLNPFEEDGPRGIWSALNRKFERLVKSAEFKSIYSRKVCSHNGVNLYHTALTSQFGAQIETQNTTIIKKLQLLVRIKEAGKLSIPSIALIVNIKLLYLTTLIRDIYAPNIADPSVRACLFIREGNRLVTVTAQPNNIAFDGYAGDRRDGFSYPLSSSLKGGLDGHQNTILSRDDKSIVVKAFEKEKLLYAPNEIIFKKEQAGTRNYKRAVLAIPLLVDRLVIDEANKKDFALDRCVGILTIDTNNPDILSDYEDVNFKSLIEQYTVRITYEVVRTLLAKT